LLFLSKIICLLVAIAYYTLAERKTIGTAQRREGPNVVGYLGLLQPLADGLKLLDKKMLIPLSANETIFSGAPIIILILSFLT
jgi:NADH-quinone oxidoreductase subunit H